MSSLVSTVKPILAHNDAIYNIARKTYHGTKNQVKEIKTNHDNNKLRNKIVEAWQETLAQLEVCNAYTQTFTLKDIKFSTYGIEANVMYPKPLTVDDFEKVLERLERGIESIIVPKFPEGKKRFFTVNIVAKDVPDTPFRIIKTEAYQLVLGYGLDKNPIVWDISKNPHLLITGATGAGKSKFVMAIITNLILNTTEKDIEIYSLQIDKSDSYPFRRCKQVKCFADSLEKSLAVLNYINNILDERDKDIRPLLDQGLGENIKEVNKLNKSKNWKFLYLWIDEFPSFMVSQGDIREIKDIKLKIMQRIERIYQIGRYAGVYMIVGVQRSTIDKLPPFCKSQSTCIISMKQMNDASALNAVESLKPKDLKIKEGLIKLSNELQYVKSPNLSSQEMVKLIDPYRISEQEQTKREIDYNKWFNKNPKNANSILNIDDITLPKESKKQDNGSKVGKVKVDKYKDEIKKQSDTIVNQKQQLVQSNTRCMDLERNLSEKDKELNKYKVENEKLRADNNKLQVKINQNQNIIKTKNKLRTVEKEIEDDNIE